MFTRTTRTTVSDADMQKLVNAANVLHDGDPITLKELEQKPVLARYVLNGLARQLNNVRNRQPKKAAKSK